MAPFRRTFRPSNCAPGRRSASRTDSVANSATVHRWLASWLALALLATSGCAMFRSNKGEDDLEFGVKAYEDGELVYSAKLLQASLDNGLRFNSDRVRAHKYLAFIHCASSRVPQCRDEFKKALDLDPSFDLRENEAGHPTWGPVFRSVKVKK